jgi:hypothetical protein
MLNLCWRDNFQLCGIRIGDPTGCGVVLPIRAESSES